MILLRACPVLVGSTEWTEVRIEGEDEEDIAAILASRLGSLEWEVQMEEDNESA